MTWSSLSRCLKKRLSSVLHTLRVRGRDRQTLETANSIASSNNNYFTHTAYKIQPEAKWTHQLVAKLVLLVPNTTEHHKISQALNDETINHIHEILKLAKTFM